MFGTGDYLKKGLRFLGLSGLNRRVELVTPPKSNNGSGFYSLHTARYYTHPISGTAHACLDGD
jgi:hypothetical protein